ADTPRRAHQRPRDRARDASLAQPARHRLRQIPLRAHQCRRPAGDDLDREPDVRAARCQRSARRRVERGEPIMKFFEDIRGGETSAPGPPPFTAEDIKAFAARFDPQPFHLDEAAAARSHFGRLCASGWHTACVWMRLMIAYRRREDEELCARGEAVGRLGPSPRFPPLQRLKPVYVGDTVSYGTEGVEMRPLASRPGWGMIFVRNTGVNQRGGPGISVISRGFGGPTGR